MFYKNIFFLIFFSFSSLFYIKSDVLYLDNQTKFKYPAGYISVLTDKSCNLSVIDVIKSEGFEIISGSSPSYGFINNAIWVKLSLTDNSDNKKWLLELSYSLMDNIEFYQISDGKVIKKVITGYNYPFIKREIAHRYFVFEIDFSQNRNTEILLRLKNSDRMEIPLKIVEEKEFIKENQINQFILGVFYGILLIMILYALILFFSFFSNSYLNYAFFLISFALFQGTQNGIIYEFFYPEHLNLFSHYIPQLISIIVFLAIQFTQSYINTKVFTPKINNVLNIFKTLAIIIFILIFFITYSLAIQIAILSVIIGAVLIIQSAIIIFLKNYTPAKFFLIAWTIFIIGAIIYSLKVFAVLPNNIFTTYAIQAGSTFEVIILSIGLGNRIFMMKKEKESAKIEALQSQLETIDMLKKNEIQLENFLMTLSSTIESRDIYTGGHVERVARLAKQIGLALGMNENEIRRLYLGAIVHDIGKIGISDTILNKPDKLSKEEYEEIKKHPRKGYDILIRMKDANIEALVALYHQERWDGNGYPEGLLDSDIPIEARIVTVADYWDAITTDRPYRKAMILEEALSIMESERGKAFDPILLDLFINKKLYTIKS